MNQNLKEALELLIDAFDKNEIKLGHIQDSGRSDDIYGAFYIVRHSLNDEKTKQLSLPNGQ